MEGPCFVKQLPFWLINCRFYNFFLLIKAYDVSDLSSEMLDGCRALLGMANVTNAAVFNQLLKSIRLFCYFYRLQLYL